MTQFDPKSITQLLDTECEQLAPPVRHALARARARALTRQKPAARVLKLSSGHEHPVTLAHWLLLFAILATVLAGGKAYWSARNEQINSHLDLAILMDEMPVDVFVDK